MLTNLLFKGELESNKGFLHGNYKTIIDMKTRYLISRSALLKKLITQENLVEIFFSENRDFTKTAFAEKLVKCNFFGPLSNH